MTYRIMIIPIIAIVIFIANNAIAFEGLSTLTIPTSLVTVSVHYDKKYSTIINEDITDEESGIKTIRLIETKLKANSNNIYIIDFNEGVSNDPCFQIYYKENNKLTYIDQFGGLDLTIPYDGYLYSSGHANTMFNKRKKFAIENNNVIEIEQPFYYIGIESKTTVDIDIFSDLNMTKVVAHLVKGTTVSVIMNYNKNYYLIKTDFGLLGWIMIPSGKRDKTIIEDIYFAGD